MARGIKSWIWLGLKGLFVLILIGPGLVWAVLQDPEFGGEIAGHRVEASAQYAHTHFKNPTDMVDYDLWVNLQDFMGSQNRVPPGPFPTQSMRLSENAAQGLEAYWLGHATVFVELEGVRILTDPMLTSHAFPVKWLSPKRHNPPPISLSQLPPIDIAVISHDHYDHLDMKTVTQLAKGGTHFFVGLGVGAHLEAWGIDSAQIHELDWWSHERFKGLEVHCTPARHYSGRRSMDNSTLWASWVIKGQELSIFHSGDSGYSDHFKAIGERLGPIDMTFIKIGDYGLDLGWQDIHMIPERSIDAHIDVQGQVLFPIHWGTFQLSNHDWDEPIKRAVFASESAGISMVTPMLGEKITAGQPVQTSHWWSNLSGDVNSD